MERIPQGEYEDRKSRAFQALERAGLDCVLVFTGVNFRYFTGLSFARERYRIVVLLMGHDGKTWLFGPSFEEAKLCKNAAGAAVETWTDAENQYQRIADTVIGAYGNRARIGLEPTTDYYHIQGLQEFLPRASVSNGSVATDALRAIKTDVELDCLREAAERTHRRMERVESFLSDGMTERELAALYGPSAMIQFGRTTSLPNAPAGDVTLRKNDIIVIDAGDRVNGYRSDIARTFFWGEPSRRMKEVYRLVAEAEEAAFAVVKPGEPAANVDLAARGVIDRAGYADFFLHRGGHGIGLGFHEIPICAGDSEDVLQPGMVLTAEPGVYLPGEFGVRLEDDILVTETGFELLAERKTIYSF